MIPFRWVRASSVEDALHWISEGGIAIAGGTNLVDHLKNRLLKPDFLVDLGGLPLQNIAPTEEGGLHIGALVSNNDLAQNQAVRERYPVLSRALLAGASGQIRNMASLGGNLLQRTRCSYFYDAASPCNKRQPGSGCPVSTGYSGDAALFGASPQCLATYPGDMAVALTHYDALVELTGPRGPRSVPIAQFYRLPGDQPQHDTVRQADELITGVVLPKPALEGGVYLKVRERESYAFALVSLAASLDARGGRVGQSRLVLGGVSSRPWRLEAVEAFLKGRKIDDSLASQAGALAKQGAVPLPDNAYKLTIIERLVRRTLLTLSNGRSRA